MTRRQPEPGPWLTNLGRSVDVGSDGQRIAVLLREAIRRGALPPGTRLVQRELAAVLGVSRIPVRDALQTLSAEGLVTAVGTGLFVTELAPEDIDELYGLRLLIEPALAQWIVVNCSTSERRVLRSLVQEMDSQFAAGDQLGWSQTNFAFHDRLYASARRPMFARIAHQLLTLVESYSRMATMYLGGWTLSQEEHRVMIDAIDGNDAATLEATLKIHLERAQADLVHFTADVAHSRLTQSGDAAAGFDGDSAIESAVERFVAAYATSMDLPSAKQVDSGRQ